MKDQLKILIIILVTAAVVLSCYFIIDDAQTNAKLILENATIEQGDDIEILLVDDNDNPLSNKIIEVTLEGNDSKNNYTLKTDDNGTVSIQTTQYEGSYTIICCFKKMGYNDALLKKKINVTSTKVEEISSIISNSQSSASTSYPAEYVKSIGGYTIVEENYNGDFELALVRDSQGRLWVLAGDGFYEPSHFR